MKKIMFSAAILIAGFQYSHAQSVTATAGTAQIQNGVNVQTEKAPSKLKIEDMYFKESLHDFGTLVEGPNADHEFEFVNRGKEPILISNAQASCGCTTPSYTKEPVLPGKTGKIKVSYHTQGRVAPFTKTVSLTTNAGIKVLTIKGEVEKAPASSVPQNQSLMKTN